MNKIKTMAIQETAKYFNIDLTNKSNDLGIYYKDNKDGFCYFSKSYFSKKMGIVVKAKEFN